MPYDPHGPDEGDDQKGDPAEGQQRRFSDFDCPDCSANNPYDDTFGDRDEVRCYYCGQLFLATVTDGGKLRLREA